MTSPYGDDSPWLVAPQWRKQAKENYRAVLRESIATCERDRRRYLRFYLGLALVQWLLVVWAMVSGWWLAAAILLVGTSVPLVGAVQSWRSAAAYIARVEADIAQVR